VAGVGVVSACHHERRDVKALELGEVCERLRTRDIAKGAGHGVRMAVKLESLARQSHERLAPVWIQADVVRGEEALDSALGQPVGEAVPVGQ
jgi:hypothetical protein